MSVSFDGRWAASAYTREAYQRVRSTLEARIHKLEAQITDLQVELAKERPRPMAPVRCPECGVEIQ